MASPASLGRHPIHPMLIPFPLALWFFSLIADVIYLWRGNPVWRDWIAFYALLGGIVGGVLAAVPGFVDWLSLKDREVVRIANWHARLNVIALLIFVASFYLRTDERRGAGRRKLHHPLRALRRGRHPHHDLRLARRRDGLQARRGGGRRSRRGGRREVAPRLTPTSTGERSTVLRRLQGTR